MSDRSRSANLDAVRAVAALTVIASHGFILLSNSRPRNIGLGHVVLSDISGGVYLFFALSGYLIAGPFLGALHDGRPLPDWRGARSGGSLESFPLTGLRLGRWSWSSCSGAPRSSSLMS